MKRKESQREGLEIGLGALNVMPVVGFLSWSQSDDFFFKHLLFSTTDNINILCNQCKCELF